jgi:hypothetical protein
MFTQLQPHGIVHGVWATHGVLLLPWLVLDVVWVRFLSLAASAHYTTMYVASFKTAQPHLVLCRRLGLLVQ